MINNYFFDCWENDCFALEYYKGFVDTYCIRAEIYKDEINVKYHWENGDYYGPENDCGSLPGGYYGRGYEIDDVKYPEPDLSYLKEDDKISEAEFIKANNLSESELSDIKKNIYEIFDQCLNEYINNNQESFINE